MVVIFTDGSTGNLQALYLILSRDDIVVDGIVVDGAICDRNIGSSNVIQMLDYMHRDIEVYVGITPNSSYDGPEVCTPLELELNSNVYVLEPHTVLMEKYMGVALSLVPFTTVAHWIKQGAITSLTAFMGGIQPDDIGHHIYSMDPVAWEYVRTIGIPKTLWYIEDIIPKLTALVRMLYISNTVLHTVTPVDTNKWRFWDLTVAMSFLGYLQ
jgi:hypothetical protein